MDGVMLLAEARAAGLAVTANGDRLVIEGPRDAEPIAVRLLAAKPRVIAALATRPAYLPLDPLIAEDVARKTPRDVIGARVDRLNARAALLGATPLDIAVADDWRRVLDAKQGDC